MLKQLIKHCVEKGLRIQGYELKEIGSPVRGFPACLQYAKSRGLRPKTVLDVGVGHGTPWLYDAFPNAKLVLFEPACVFDSDLQQLVQRYGADAHRVALAGEAGSGEFHLNTVCPTSSSLLSMDTRFAKYAADVQAEHRFEEQTVSLETLDHLNKYEPPYVLKLDVEGGEIGVLEGGRKTLENTDLLITEMSVIRRYSGAPAFARMIQFLDECDFELFDIPTLAQANCNGQLIYLDAAFVRKDSRLWPP